MAPSTTLRPVAEPYTRRRDCGESLLRFQRSQSFAGSPQCDSQITPINSIGGRGKSGTRGRLVQQAAPGGTKIRLAQRPRAR